MKFETISHKGIMNKVPKPAVFELGAAGAFLSFIIPVTKVVPVTKVTAPDRARLLEQHINIRRKMYI